VKARFKDGLHIPNSKIWFFSRARPRPNFLPSFRRHGGRPSRPRIMKPTAIPPQHFSLDSHGERYYLSFSFRSKPPPFLRDDVQVIGTTICSDPPFRLSVHGPGPSLSSEPFFKKPTLPLHSSPRSCADIHYDANSKLALFPFFVAFFSIRRLAPLPPLRPRFSRYASSSRPFSPCSFFPPRSECFFQQSRGDGLSRPFS